MNLATHFNYTLVNYEEFTQLLTGHYTDDYHVFQDAIILLEMYTTEY